MGKVLGSFSKAVSKIPIVGGLVSDIISPDTLLGQEQAATPTEVIDVGDPLGRKYQNQLLEQYGKSIGGVNDMVFKQVAAQENQAMQNARDEQMRINQAVAQRGLGKSSIGLGQILGSKNRMAENISAIRAQEPMLRMNNLNMATSGINQILNEQGGSKIVKMGQQAGPRTGGLMPLVGAGIGGILGGPMGASVGMNVGQYASQVR